jgi:two-component system response regulator YesN
MFKLLIVDDEKKVLKGLHKILTQHCPEYEIVSMEQNPTEALQILEEGTAVDVVITDVKMPDMDGIELTQKIRSQYPNTEVIVLSGYSDFEYVRQAMKNGAYDYLLKPIKYQNIINILKMIENRVKKKEEKEQMNQHKRILEIAISGMKELPKEWSAYGQMQMMVIKSQQNKDPLFGNHLKQELTNVCEEQYIMDIITLDETIVVLFQHPLNLSIIKQKMLPNLRNSGFHPYVAIQDVPYSPKCMELTYLTCKKMVDFLEFNEFSTVVEQSLYLTWVDHQKKYALKDNFSIPIMMKYIINAQPQKLQHYLSANLNTLYLLDVYMDPIRIKQEAVGKLVSLEHHLKEHGFDIEQHFGSQTDFLHEVKNIKTFRNLLNWINKFTMAIIMKTEAESQMPHYIHVGIQYIDMHYMEDISLKTISDEVYLNPWYFSTQFKKFIGVTFSDYLNQARVRKAKEFLKQQDLKIYQVAEMVGFQDAAYFSTVFKGIESISPKEYKNLI